MTLTWLTYVIVCPLVMLAGFVDSVAGGGGLISLPAYMLAGLPTHMAAGTNKMSACLGTLASTGKYMKSGKVNGWVAVLAALGALPGSWIGATVQQLINAQAVKIMMLCVIPVVAAVVLLNRKSEEGVRRVPENAVKPVSLAIGLVIGFYDGLVGPGTGTFLIILFTMVLGMDTVSASGSAKVVNLASNVAALITYVINGNVLYALAIPAAVCGIAGNLLGANMTIRHGTGFVRKMLIIVLALLLAKMAWDVLS